MDKINIGKMIRDVLKEKLISVSKFAMMAHTDRSNMYRILQRSSIDFSVLERYSRIPKHDFFQDLSNHLRNYYAEE